MHGQTPHAANARHAFSERNGTPASWVYGAFFRFAHAVLHRKQHLHVDDSSTRALRGPFVALCNHESFYDFYYVKQLFPNARPAFVVNRHYVSIPIVKTLARRAGFIPKRLFTPDPATPLGIMRAIRAGFPVVIFPEGRLSVSGQSYPILDRGAAFYKRLHVDIVLCGIRGAYLCNPKWRKRFYRGEISVYATRIVTKEEAASMSDGALAALIRDALRYDDSTAQHPMRMNGRAKGLSDILYRCIDCGALYSTEGKGNDLCCRACGRTHTLDDTYRFEHGLSIAAYYDRIKEIETDSLATETLTAPVRVTVFLQNGGRRREHGTCTLDANGFGYRGDRTSFSIPLCDLPALPFSCNAEFETYHNGDLYYFYPTENPRQVVRWALLVDRRKEMQHETQN